MKLKLMMITLIMCFMGITYGQTDSLINEFETKNMLSMGINAKTTYYFKVYNDSLVQTITGGMGFKQYKKKNIPVKVVYSIKLQDISQGDFLYYKFENDTQSILITVRPNGKYTVTIRVKDSFTGEIGEIMYY